MATTFRVLDTTGTTIICKYMNGERWQLITVLWDGITPIGTVLGNIDPFPPPPPNIDTSAYIGMVGQSAVQVAPVTGAAQPAIGVPVKPPTI